MPRVYLNQNVYEAALDRIRRLYDEFEQVIVSVSGGKDSTVVLNLALMVAEEKGRLPVPVFFVDQEAEWACVIAYIRELFRDPRIDPHWLQIPIRLFNATSEADDWLHCWDPAVPDQWIRPKEPDSIHENILGTDRFAECFRRIPQAYFPDQTVAQLGGVRTEESMGRLKGLTSNPTYKDITWGTIDNRAKGQYTFYPIYDWTYVDVWKAIHDHGWGYCPLYDYQYQYGVPVREMRVSNVHHETALKNLTYLQEVEADTWNKVTARLGGINATRNVWDTFVAPKSLPPMFADWREYREYLLANLIADPDKRAKFRKLFDADDANFHESIHQKLWVSHISAILANDYHGTKIQNFRAAHSEMAKGYGTRGGKYGYQPRQEGNADADGA